MQVKTISSDRKMILEIMQEKTGETAVYSYSPDFSYKCGEYTFRRNGVITCESDASELFPELARLGLIEQSSSDSEYESIFTYPVNCHTGKTLLNLIGILSARQRLINQAIGKKAFQIDPGLVCSLYEHPPKTINSFLAAMYNIENRHKKDATNNTKQQKAKAFVPTNNSSPNLHQGLIISRDRIVLIGFEKAVNTDMHLCKQLSDAIISSALSLKWVKPFTRNVRNRKYAMKTWMNQIGMTGPEYEEARHVFLDRLYGKADHRKLL